MKNAKATPNHSLRRERELRGWSQCYVADQISAPASSYIHRWEKGLAFPSPFYREKLCALFQKNADELGFPVTSTPRHLSLVPQDSNRVTNVSSHFWYVPYQRNPFFTGREEALNDLYTTFFAEKGGPFSQVQALSGIGGIGKTQAAIEYIYRYRNAYAKVLWMQAETREDLNASCVALRALLKLSSHSEQKEDCAIELIKLWLTSHENWLLILDNIEDFSLLQTILPIDPQGHTLQESERESPAH
ncbi:helix-turn-helix domain-containing protein [Ktedonospora formicarum]|uniref:HTH cro/C1-type domain-containing protein n=1 Tax=Ktedonospora formicarum TaxID=2778364 RepID=A0A8J3HZP3_9CHLR|nr:helix-turn-helix transcriptional regulator [Ktedonospora formicarum]GHO46131.1 hypothetical protein KSX_42940 [Ktedonospora formicarum]